MKLFQIPLIIFLCGVFITIFGAWAKITHLAFADATLTAGMLVQGAGVAYSIYILIRNK
jgi:hypothetical protein